MLPLCRSDELYPPTCPSIAPFPPPALDDWLREPSVLPPLLQQTLALFPSQLNVSSKFFNCAIQNSPTQTCAKQLFDGRPSTPRSPKLRQKMSKMKQGGTYGPETGPPSIDHRVSVVLQVEQGKVARQVPQKEHRFPVHSNSRMMEER